MTSEALEIALYKAPETCSDDFTSVPTPEIYSAAHQELMQNKHLTRKLLHHEWTQTGHTQVSYSRFCHHCRHYKKSLGQSLTNTYAGGEYSFIDFSGDSFGLTPKGGGDKIKTELFVWCFGASNMTYWEFRESQKQSDLLLAMEHGHGAWPWGMAWIISSASQRYASSII